MAATAALAVGLVGGGYGVASAVNGSSATTGTAAAPATTATPAQGRQAPDPQHPWGGQRPDETALTGSALTSVTAAAVAKVPNGTVVRVETDADGHAAYEVHMTKADGSPVTVYVDKGFDVVSVESR